jgi:hypothetical protein
VFFFFLSHISPIYQQPTVSEKDGDCGKVVEIEWRDQGRAGTDRYYRRDRGHRQVRGALSKIGPLRKRLIRGAQRQEKNKSPSRSRPVH